MVTLPSGQDAACLLQDHHETLNRLFQKWRFLASLCVCVCVFVFNGGGGGGGLGSYRGILGPTGCCCRAEEFRALRSGPDVWETQSRP